MQLKTGRLFPIINNSHFKQINSTWKRAMSNEHVYQAWFIETAFHLSSLSHNRCWTNTHVCLWMTCEFWNKYISKYSQNLRRSRWLMIAFRKYVDLFGVRCPDWRGSPLARTGRRNLQRKHVRQSFDPNSCAHYWNIAQLANFEWFLETLKRSWY